MLDGRPARSGCGVIRRITRTEVVWKSSGMASSGTYPRNSMGKCVDPVHRGLTPNTPLWCDDWRRQRSVGRSESLQNHWEGFHHRLEPLIGSPMPDGQNAFVRIARAFESPEE